MPTPAFRQQAVATAGLALLLLMLSGCASLQAPDLPAPPAAEDQVAREIQFLRRHFFTSSCFKALRDSEAEVEATDVPKEADSYALMFATSPLMSDAIVYTLRVRKSDRMGYLRRTGGIGGMHQWTGPQPFAHCLQPVFREAAAGG